MLLLEDRLIHKHRGEREPRSINKGPQRLPYACSNGQKSRHDARGVGSLQSGDCRIGRRLESRRSSIGGSNRRPATVRKSERWFWFIGLASMNTGIVDEGLVSVRTSAGTEMSSN